VLDTRKIGIIIGQVKTSEFIFATNYDINRLEYVAIESQELIETEEGNLEEINIVIISQIFEVWADSRALPEGLKIEDAEKIIAAGLADSKFFAKTRILGYLHEENVFQPRRAINPGNFVHIAPNELLEQFYSYPEEEGLHIGHLITRSDVPVHITVNGFRRAILKICSFKMNDPGNFILSMGFLARSPVHGHTPHSSGLGHTVGHAINCRHCRIPATSTPEKPLLPVPSSLPTDCSAQCRCWP